MTVPVDWLVVEMWPGMFYYAFTARFAGSCGRHQTCLRVVRPDIPIIREALLPVDNLWEVLPCWESVRGFGNYGIGYYKSAYGESDCGFFHRRIDMCPARVMLYDVHIRFNASANDSASIVMYVFDNLPEGQWQPCATNIPSYTRRVNTSGNYAFNLFSVYLRP